MSIPSWWAFVLLATAAWRTFELLANDDITDRPRRWLLRLGDAYLDEKNEWKDIPRDYRVKLGKWLTCPYCFGFWVGVSWWVLWEIWPTGALFFTVPFAINTVQIIYARFLSK